MLLVLTYHRIVNSPGDISGFFDICTDELETHGRAAASAWGGGASPGALQDNLKGNGSARHGVLFTFDDGTADHYSIAAPSLERNGLRGVFFVSTALLDTPGYLTLCQCKELQQRGHAIESHSHEHKGLVGLTKDDLQNQLHESRRRLRDAGLGQWEFIAVPGGYFDATVIQMAGAAGYHNLRTLKWGYNRNTDPFCVESITVNRKTSGQWFNWLASPHFEWTKKAIYQTKENLKNCSPKLYSWFRYSKSR